MVLENVGVKVGGVKLHGTGGGGGFGREGVVAVAHVGCGSQDLVLGGHLLEFSLEAFILGG